MRDDRATETLIRYRPRKYRSAGQKRRNARACERYRTDPEYRARKIERAAAVRA
jgi:hypothetical protein